MQRRHLMAALGAALVLSGWQGAQAQAPTPAPAPTPGGQDAGKPFKPEELDQMLAPIALYPDGLLAQTLMAAGYPLEVVDAARWAKANPALKGDAAVAAVKDKSWDVSVKSLTAFPQVLVQLSDHLDWMQKIGDAMVAQQQDVADSIQRLRAKAETAGNLKSGKEQTVTTEGAGADRTVVIAPTNPEVIYVPAYDPNTVYGAWPTPAYPPTYYPPPPGYGYGNALIRGLLFGVGIAAAGAIFGGWNWGRGGGNSYVNVNVNRAVNIDRNFNVNNINNGRWQHDGTHRKGVAYRDQASRDRFGQNRPGADQRKDFRGQLENRPGGGQANARPNLPNRGQGPAQHPNIANRDGANRAGGQHPNLQNRGGTNRGGGAIRGVDNGQRVNREANRGRAQQTRAGGHTGGGGGGGGARAAGGGGSGGGGGRPAGGGGGARPAGGGGGGGAQRGGNR
ncbi:MAG: DUF3300 domain-containing protein [Hyphomicrobiales bacterium]